VLGFAQLDCGAEFFGEHRDDRMAENIDGRPIEQCRQADGHGPGCDRVTEIDVEFELVDLRAPGCGGSVGTVHPADATSTAMRTGPKMSSARAYSSNVAGSAPLARR